MSTSSLPSEEPLEPTSPVESQPQSEFMQKLIFWLIAAFLLRLFLIRFPYMFTLDVNTFRSWADTIVKVGPTNFYTSTWSDYPPLFMYFLWIWNQIQMVFTGSTVMSEQWAKIPACIADVVNGLLIFQLLKGRVAIRSAYRTAVMYVFNPVVIFVSAIWGQVDAIITLMMLLISLVVLLNWLIPAAALAAAAVLVKPQGLFMIPLVFFSMWFRQPLWKWPLAIFVGLAVVWISVVPATWHTLSSNPILQPFFWLNQQMQKTGENYPHSTVNAFNIWMLPPPNESWKSDARMLWFLDHKTWGLLLMVTVLGLVGWYLWRNRHHFGAMPYFLAGSVVLTGFYMLPTRMHERYIFPAIAFLALAQACNRKLSWIYWGFSITSFLSIAYIFFFYNDKSAWVEGLKSLMEEGPKLGSLELNGMVILSLVNIWLFGELLSFLFVKSEIVQELTEHPLVRALRTLPARVAAQAVSWADVAIPAAFALGFLGFALWRLGLPSEQIFDEVYHARTAMEYLAGVNPYEWTHPPLAKLIASLGILMFGGQFSLEAKEWTEHMAFSWRFMSVVFGALTLVVTYALTRSLFNNRVIASLATGFLMLDGVFFVQARVAMTNIYEVFFILLGTLGTWLYIKTDRRRWMLLMGFGLACALATRWSSLYAWGLTGLLLLWHLWTVKRLQWGVTPLPEGAKWHQRLLATAREIDKGALARWVGWVALSMGVIPVLVYALSYIPYVMQGSGDWAFKLFSWRWDNQGWGKVLTMQKDMWGYHANLNATHPYSSPWWSWPLMLRPTWYHFQDLKNGTLTGVWAIGNAAIWWASIPALGYAAYLGWRDKLKSLGLVATLGFGLWLLWGVQPRPLLYMHYMFETIPFACMALAYIFYLLWQRPMPAPAPDATGAGVWFDWLSRHRARVFVGVYVALLVAWFIFYYPLLSALPTGWDYYRLHLWFNRSWI